MLSGSAKPQIIDFTIFNFYYICNCIRYDCSKKRVQFLSKMTLPFEKSEQIGGSMSAH